jgi:hypothetical protein
MRAVALAALAASAAGHGMMTFPKPRNGIDGGVAPFDAWHRAGLLTLSNLCREFSLRKQG